MEGKTSRTSAVLLLLAVTAAQLYAQSTAFGKTAFAKLEIFFLGRQQRWTVLYELTAVFGAAGDSDYAIAAAKKALQVAKTTAGSDNPRVAASLHWLAVVYEGEGRHAESQSAAVRALAIHQRLFGDFSPAVADDLIVLARINKRQGQLTEAEAYYRSALHIRDSPIVSDKNRAPVADILVALGEICVAQGNFVEARRLYEQALETLALGNDDPATVDIWKAEADLSAAQNRYSEAESQYQHVLRLQKGTMDGDDPRLIGTLNELARLCRKQGNSQATVYEEQARDIRQHAFGPTFGKSDREQRKRLHTLFWNSFLLFNQGEYPHQIRVDDEAVRFAEAYLGPDDWRVAGFLIVQAVEYSEFQGDYAKAESLLLRAKRIQEKMLGTEDPSLGETLNDLAAIYIRQVRYEDAVPLLKHAIWIQKAMMSVNAGEDPLLPSASYNPPREQLARIYVRQGHPDAMQPLLDALEDERHVNGPATPRNYALARISISISHLYQMQGRFGDAEKFVKQALDFDNRPWGLGWSSVKHFTLAIDYDELVELYLKQGKYEAAEPLCGKAVDLVKGLGAAQTLTSSSTLYLARTFVLEGKYPEAERLLLRQLRREEQLKLIAHRDATIKQLALAYMRQEDFAKAKPMLELSKSIEAEHMFPDSLSRLSTLGNLGFTLFELGLTDAAEDSFTQSFEILDHQLRSYFAYMSEQDRLVLLDAIDSQFALYFSLVERFHAVDSRLLGRMYNRLLWRKGMVLKSIVELRQKMAGNPHGLELLNSLAQKRARISNLSNTGAAVRSQAWLRMMADLREEADGLERTLSLTYSREFVDQQNHTATWSEIREQIEGQNIDATVEFVVFRYYDRLQRTDSKHYAALVLKKGATDPTFAFLGTASDLEGQPFAGYQDWVSVRGATTAVGSRLYDRFWKPLIGILGNAKRLYVAPDGVLNQVSLGVVPSNDGQLLMEKYDTFRVVNSTADIVPSAPTRVVATKSAMLFGSPKYLMTLEEQKRSVNAIASVPARDRFELAKARSLTPNAANDGPCRDLPPGGVLCPLPGTSGEIWGIYELLQRYHWDIQGPYTDAAALEEVVKNVQHPQLLHIATHGFFAVPNEDEKADSSLNRRDPMLLSGLYFAGADRSLKGEPTSEEVEDGVLTALEVTGLNLQGTELVVLSACDTGRGELRTGEGVLGLRRGFQEAGAGSVMMSMWSVPDEETQELMRLFYAQWVAGTDKYEALKHAQLALRERLRKEGKNHDFPHYWGGFVLIGRDIQK